MSRRVRNHGPSLSLFPFLCILFGVIGMLTLIIAGMMVIGLHSKKLEQVIELTPFAATSKSPLYVECHKQGVIVHPEGIDVPLAELTRDLVLLGKLGKADSADPKRWKGAGSAYLQRLGLIKQESAKHYLLLLVRSDGLQAFHAALAMAEQAKVGLGYEPVFEGGPIRFRGAS